MFGAELGLKIKGVVSIYGFQSQEMDAMTHSASGQGKKGYED